MIRNDQELKVTLERIEYFHRQVTRLRQAEDNPANYRLSASSYLTELDRMNLEVRDYLWLHPREFTTAAAPSYPTARPLPPKLKVGETGLAASTLQPA